jgi:hypothetical protein
VVDFTFRPLYPRKRALVTIEWEAGWTPELIWAFLSREKAVVSAGDRIPESPACILVPVKNKLSRIVVVSVEVFL